MTGSRLVALGCFTLLTLPVLSFGQSRFDNHGASAPDNFPATVSVHELKIPEKARNAYNKGAQRFASKDWAGSIAEFQRAIAAYREFYEAYYKIGLADLELKLSQDAETAFRKSIELSEGRFAPALFGLGLTLGNQKQFDDALAFIRSGLGLEPTSPRGNFTLAWVLYSANRVAEAEKSAREAVLYSPTFAIAHLLLAQIHRSQNNSVAMVEDLDTYLRLDPNGPRSIGVRAFRDEAQRVLDQASAGSTVANADR
jgi:tetratricopeptide (TPR) repeat protein